MTPPPGGQSPAPSAAEKLLGSDHTRRRFLGYVIAAPTLTAAAQFAVGAGTPAAAVIPSGPQPAELYDLNDFLTDSAKATEDLITVTINEDGTASFALPRSENGQGIMTSTAMIIAEELNLPVSKIRVTLADARPELLFNQLTGGSNTTISTFTPIRVAAAIAMQRLLEAAALKLGADVTRLVLDQEGVISDPNGGGAVTYGELAGIAASDVTEIVGVDLKGPGEFKVIGKPYSRTDARAAVTGRKKFTTDLKIPGALPTMVCRAPRLNGTPQRIINRAEVLRMPGVTHVEMVSTGIAVRARTFGQCIDAVRALRAEWNDGTVAGQSDATVLEELRAAELPLLAPALPGLTESVEEEFVFYFRSNSSLETNSAIADVREDRAEVWSALKSPITAQQRIAELLGMSQDQVTVHVMQGGGSFGRKLFFDAALEAAEISQKMKVPVKLMWHRADDSRVGRAHPMAISRIRANIVGGQVATFEQRHTSVVTDNGHGLGELITANIAKLDIGGVRPGELGFAQTIFALTQEVPYNYGIVDQLLNEVNNGFNTGSMRNIYSPDTCTARELITDELAKRLGKDPLEFRLEHAKTARMKRVIEAVANAGDWGRRMPAGTAQGIAVHKEYKGVNACLVEIDNRPRTRDRSIRNAVTGPRVTKVVMAVDVGLVVNPRGLRAQMQGGIMDGIALALTSSLHLRDGYFLEGSWDNYFYTRQWNVPPEVQVIIMPSDSEQPGGAGEFGVASTFAAVACAYSRVTGRMQKSFPINHDELSFTPKSTVPPIPQSPTNGLRFF